MSRPSRFVYAAVGLAAVLGSRWARAEQIAIGPTDDLKATVATLQPGDELVLDGGTYNLTSRFGISVSGTESSPIVIRSKDGEVATITRPDAGQNTINIEGARHVVLRGLEITGGSHGVRIMDSSFITIEQCEIHATADVAISANFKGNSYQGLIFRRNHIHDTSGTGEGMYLGCNDAECVMFDSIIEGNYIHDTKVGVNQGDGIEIKHGSYNNVVRDNVIHDTNYPCIIVYGTEGKPRNIVERNVMWGCGDHAIQAAADAVIRNNIILGANANGIHNQIHQGATPGNLEIVHNTIVVQNDGIRTNDIAREVLIANNAVYSQGGNAIRLGGMTGLATVAGNVGTGSSQGFMGGFDASGSIAADFVDLDYSQTKFDAFPAPGGKLVSAGSGAHVVDVDFNGTPRGGEPHVGAYHFSDSGNPGWPIGAGPKDEVSGGGGSGGTRPGTGGSTTGGGTAGAGGNPANRGASDDEGGCACRASGSRAPGSGWLALCALGALGLARRRRARRSVR